MFKILTSEVARCMRRVRKLGVECFRRQTPGTQGSPSLNPSHKTLPATRIRHGNQFPATLRGGESWLAVVVLLAVLPIGLRAAASGQSAKPNVLFIAVDDLNHWVGYLGRSAQAKTPHIDQLAGRGVRFTRSYCASPVCNPSRAALMSGLRPWTTGVYSNGDDWRKVLAEDLMLTSAFRRAGYYVAGAGKIYHGGLPRRSEWDDYLDDEGRDPRPAAGQSPGVGGIRFAPLDCQDEDLQDYRITSWVIDQLGKKHDKPFFLACGLHKPHMPWNVPRKYYDMFPLDQIQLPPYREDDLADIPPAGLEMARHESDHESMLKSGRWKEAIQAYLAASAYADMNIGRLMEALDRSPYRDNTMIVFWGDHGWHLGEKHHWRKFALWEEATRAPLIWVVPGVTQPGSICDRSVDFMSIYPTLMDLCGIAKPPHVEASSIRSLLEKPDAPWDIPAVTTFRPGNHSVRTEAWRYIRYANGDEELYDEAQDPYEWTNLASDSRHAARKVELRQRLNEPRRPNVVFILADDLGWTDLACYGSGYYATPHIDRMVAQGMRFTSGYTCGPNCQPTRAALMTGRYGPRTGIYTVGATSRFDTSQRPLVPVPNVIDLALEEVTIAEALKQAGYVTGMFGKWHLGDEPEHHPTQQGFDEAIVSAGSHFNFHTRPEVEVNPDTYLADFLTDRACDFIERHKDQSFFLYLPHFAVHGPWQAKQQWIEKFKDKPPAGGHDRPVYAAMIASVDESVGRVLDKLDALHLSENTLVIFSSDNGGVGGYQAAGVPTEKRITDNAPLRGGKGMLYEGGIRVPYVFRWPGRIAPRAVCEEPINSVDLYPTLLDLAGAMAPSDRPRDGLSYLPLLLGREPKRLDRDAIYWHFPGYLGAADGAWRTLPVGAIHAGDYKLLEFFEDGRLELYNLKDDPGEQHDLAAIHSQLAAELRAKLAAWRETIGAPMPRLRDASLGNTKSMP